MTSSVFEDLDRQHDELGRLAASLDEAAWSAPTRCEGWSVSDVLLHLAQTDELVIAGCTGEATEVVRFFSPEMEGVENVDDAAGLAVQNERGAAPAELLVRWRTAADRSRQLLRDRPDGQRIPWVIGDLPARTLATTRLSESWIHTGDIAEAVGKEAAVDDRLWHITRLAWRTLPYAFTRAGAPVPGPVSLELAAPSGDTWSFEPDEPVATTITGTALDWCLLAARRRPADQTDLVATGPDGDSVLSLARTYA